MANIRINFANNTIEINAKFANAASEYGSAEYRELMAAKNDFPTFEVKVNKPSTKKNNSFKGLTIAYMEEYIKGHDDDNGTKMNEFNVLRGKANSEDEITARASFGEIKMWFLKLKYNGDIALFLDKVAHCCDYYSIEPFIKLFLSEEK